LGNDWVEPVWFYTTQGAKASTAALKALEKSNIASIFVTLTFNWK
jgi:hypothetical protein